MSPAKHLQIAIVSGFVISAVLFNLSYVTHSSVLDAPQLIGFFVCMVFRGVHSATKMDYALIALPVNAAVYAVVIFIVSRIICRPKSN
jgi:hypothetical protein